VPFSYEVPVRFSDADPMGHLNNARALTLIEEARLAFLSDHGTLGAAAEIAEARGGVIVARNEIDYLRPMLPFAGPVRVDIAVVAVGGSSFRLGYRLYQKGEQTARACSVMVGYDYAAGTSRALRDAERARLQALLERDFLDPARP
jgi:acyl-CoA thioester hydrolase